MKYHNIAIIGASISIAIIAVLVLPRFSYSANLPTVESVFISASANAKTDAYSGGVINDLVAGSTRTIHINGVVQDLDGRDDISAVDVVFRRSGVTGGSNCSADNNDCYILNGCTLTDNADMNQKEYDCPLAIEFFADSTDSGGRFPNENWIVEVTVTDGISNTTDNSVTKEMQTLLALNIPTSINFGTLGLGEKTTNLNNVEYTVIQHGNDEADLQVSMSDSGLACSGRGEIPRSNIEWALTNVGHSDTASNDLTSSLTATNLNLPYKDQDSGNTQATLFWNIEIPPSGLEGTCSGSTIVSIIAT